MVRRAAYSCGARRPDVMRVAVASWTARHAGGIESYLAAVDAGDASMRGSTCRSFTKWMSRRNVTRIDHARRCSRVQRRVEPASRAPSRSCRSGSPTSSTSMGCTMWALRIGCSTSRRRSRSSTPTSARASAAQRRTLALGRSHAHADFGPACLALYFPRRMRRQQSRHDGAVVSLAVAAAADADRAGCGDYAQRAHEERAGQARDLGQRRCVSGVRAGCRSGLARALSPSTSCLPAGWTT